MPDQTVPTPDPDDGLTWEHNEPGLITELFLAAKDVVVRTNPACFVDLRLNDAALSLCELIVAKLGWVAAQRKGDL